MRPLPLLAAASLLAGLLALPAKVLAESSSQLRAQAQSTRSDLDNVSREIKTATHKLRLTQAERNKQQRALQEAERKIGALRQSLTQTERETRQRENRIIELEQRQQVLSEDRRVQLGQLREDVRQAYRAGRDDYFKLLLNQENPGLLARQLHYYSLFQKARSDRITHLDATLTELAEVEREEADQIRKLETLQDKLVREQGQLKVAQEQREIALKALNSEILEQGRNLKSLKQDQAALQSLMRRLERAAREQDRLDQQRRRNEERLAREAAKAQNKPAPTPAPARETPAWSQEPDYTAAYRGNCALPASGGIRAAFGSPRGGGLRWNGIVIAAASGAPVKVVKSGKVLYADFLRGYGKLVIVDHGSGFMSLYGYNQSLRVHVNDSVSAGEVVATVGGADGDAESGLYFETRLRGRPSQPGNWCSY